jgi:hypothetical protein
MQVRSRITSRAVSGLTILGAGAIAGVIAAWPAGQRHDPASSQGDVAVSYFAKGQNEPAAEPREIGASGQADRALFSPYPISPYPIYPQMAARPQAAPSAAPAPGAARRAPPAQVAAAAKPAVVASDRINTRPQAVLNDAQIASIKQRLNLTPEQEHMWPSVEAALRNLAYPKNVHASRKTGGRDIAGQVAAIDPGSEDVQHLKSAAFPLIMSFNDVQMRELQTLTHVAGLEKLVPKF